jgi:hypothetical protein
MSNPPPPHRPAFPLWGWLAVALVLGLLGWGVWAASPARHRRTQEGLRMMPGTDNLYLTRHNRTGTFDLEGTALRPAFVLAELAELERMPAGDDLETWRVKPVPRAVPGQLPEGDEGYHNYRYRDLSREQVLELCAKVAALPPMPRPERELVVRRPNLMLPGEDQEHPPVDVWAPQQGLFQSPAALAAFIGAVEEMNALPPTPGRIQELRRPVATVRHGWFADSRDRPFLAIQTNPGYLLTFMRFHRAAKPKAEVKD